MIQSYNIKLERVTKRGCLKLPQLEVMDVKLGRSNINSFKSILLSIFNEQDESSLPSSAHEPSLIEFKCGRSINYSFKSFKYLILLLIKNIQMHYFLI